MMRMDLLVFRIRISDDSLRQSRYHMILASSPGCVMLYIQLVCNFVSKVGRTLRLRLTRKRPLKEL